MKKILLIAGICLLFSACSLNRALKEAKKLSAREPGVSLQLANLRKSILSDIHYHLDFDIPAALEKPIMAHELIFFKVNDTKKLLCLDFTGGAAAIRSILVNDKKVPVDYVNEHILLQPVWLNKGANKVELELYAGEKPLNRNSDYLYTLLVPDKMRMMVPCFDQPSLKAKFTLSLKIPRQWTAIAGSQVADSVIDEGGKTLHFSESDLMSTYLFSFVAGKFSETHGKTGEMKGTFLYRETDPAKVKNSINPIFQAHTDALSFMENWTGITYPFKKFGFIAVPDFQFGGMEHVGAIQYKASSLFLDEGATKDQLINRLNLISHETAHMWFGDLVTMNWFNDVWMKEVFANFMADKVTGELMGKDAFDLKFLTDHYPAAYSVDRTAGANPVRQQLENLNNAGSMYGNIIYHKAPIVMRQLERLMDPAKFQEGVRQYLKTFSYTNAGWPDLIDILKKYTGKDLGEWNDVWVNGTGRPIIDYKTQVENGKIKNLQICQKSEYGSRKVFPQFLELTFFYPGYTRKFSKELDASSVDLNEVKGVEKPLFILFNSDGQAYGLMPLDTVMFSYMKNIESPLQRASAYISIYENMISGRYTGAERLIDIFTEMLAFENEELNLKLLSGYITSSFWSFSAPEWRKAHIAALENKIWQAMEMQKQPNNKKLLFKLYQDVFMSGSAYSRLYQIANNERPPVDIKLSEDDYTSLVFALALRRTDPDLAARQLSRITDPDRIKRFKFILPALSPEVSVRDSVFKSFRSQVNRQKEVWVLTALSYLHHPLRQQSSVNYLSESLDMLEDINRTGDIFFPQSWLQATFNYYRTEEAAGVVRDFLKNHKDYNPALKAKILQAADNLFRARKLAGHSPVF